MAALAPVGLGNCGDASDGRGEAKISILAFPDEILLIILKYAAEPRAAGVCRQFNCLNHDPAMFLPFLKAKLPPADYDRLIERVSLGNPSLSPKVLRERVWMQQVLYFQDFAQNESAEWNESSKALIKAATDQARRFDIGLYFKLRKASQGMPGGLRQPGISPSFLWAMVSAREEKIQEALAKIN